MCSFYMTASGIIRLLRHHLSFAGAGESSESFTLVFAAIVALNLKTENLVMR